MVDWHIDLARIERAMGHGAASKMKECCETSKDSDASYAFVKSIRKLPWPVIRFLFSMLMCTVGDNPGISFAGLLTELRYACFCVYRDCAYMS